MAPFPCARRRRQNGVGNAMLRTSLLAVTAGWLYSSRRCWAAPGAGVPRSVRLRHCNAAARLARVGGAGRAPRVARGSASAEVPADEEDGGGIGRRLAVAGAVLVGGGLALKRFGVDGGMDELTLKPGSMAGRTVVITGGNTGLGRESAIRLAKAGATVVITARSETKGKEAEQAIRQASGNDNVHFLKLELDDLQSVRSFAESYASQPYGDRIDILMNNAGVMAIPERKETKDGFEQQFGVNHLGHFALTGLLLPLLEKAKGFGRVINVSSTAHLFSTKKDFEGDDIMAPVKYTPWGAYGQSKLANVLFSKELDRRFKAAGIPATAVSCHPGGVDTDLARWLTTNGDAEAARKLKEESPVLQAFSAFLARTVQLGANTQLYLAAGLDGGLDKSGGEYFDNMKPGLLNGEADDKELARKLWEDSEKLTGVKISL